MNPDKIYEYKIQELVNKLNYYTKLYDEGKYTNQEWDKII